MKWFAVVSGGIYIPVEVHGIFHRVTWAKLTVVGSNSLVVGYLFLTMLNERRRRNWEQWKRPRVGTWGIRPPEVPAAAAKESTFAGS